MGAGWIDTARLSRGRRRLAAGSVDGPPGTRFVELETSWIRYRAVGDGLPVVLAPDPPNVVEHYGELIAGLSSRHRVICLEAPGFGFSYPKPGFGYGLQDQVSALTELLDRLAIGPATICFPCVAAYAAIELAARRQDLVARLILIQAPCWSQELAWASRIDRRGLVRTPFVGQAVLALGKRRIAKGWYQAALPRGHSQQGFLDLGLGALERGALYCLASAFQATFNSATEVPSIKIPALILWGAADRTHRDSRMSSMKEHVPGAQEVVFGSAGHFPELEEPERFVQIVAEFAADG